MADKSIEKQDNTDFENMSIEDALKTLEEITSRLQDGELSLSDSFNEYKKGMELVKLCSEKIEKVETDIKEISGEDDGDSSLRSE